jgi:hypothetical protein
VVLEREQVVDAGSEQDLKKLDRAETDAEGEAEHSLIPRQLSSSSPSSSSSCLKVCGAVLVFVVGWLR